MAGAGAEMCHGDKSGSLRSPGTHEAPNASTDSYLQWSIVTATPWEFTTDLRARLMLKLRFSLQ